MRGTSTFIFDLGGSYETLTRAFGGSYLNVGLARLNCALTDKRHTWHTNK
jgi:type IV secretory pathway VirB4 component